MKKLFISQPMRGKTPEEILTERNHLIHLATTKVNESVEVLESYFKDFNGVNPMGFLAKAIELLSQADVAVFAKGWQDARGCRIEHTCCEEYGVEYIDA